MGEHNYQNPSYYKLTNDDIEELTYTLHDEFLVKCVDLLDKEIVNAIVDTARENGVSTTNGVSLYSFFISLADANVSLTSTPGIAIIKSKCFSASTSNAVAKSLTRVTRGGELKLSDTYSEKICSSTRPSSSIMKAS